MKQKLANLDDPAAFRRLDTDGMLDRLHEFPEESRKALELATRFPLPATLREVDKVVILGMGGSAIGGDLVASLAETESNVPMQVYRGYHLPAYVDDSTLVIGCSYSGNTEETLTCFRQSLVRGAKTIAITTGGELRELARRDNLPAFVYDYKSPPRAAFPYGFITVLCFMQRLGFVSTAASGIEQIPSFLVNETKEIEERSPESRNSAKQLARFMHDKLAVIYGAEFLSEVAHRWKTQINENSKAWAVFESLPEMNHNSVVGYEFPSDMKGHVSVITLESTFLSPRIQLRFDVVKRLLDKAGVAFKTVSARGSTPVAQMMSTVLLGDYSSYYLAMLYGAEPGPVHAIDYLKDELARHLPAQGAA